MVLDSQQKWVKNQSVPTYGQPHPLQASSTTMDHLLQSMNHQWHLIITQSPQLILGFTLGLVHSMAFHNCVTACIHPCSVKEYSSLWKSSVLRLFIPPLSLENHTLLTFPIVLPFPKCPMVGIIQNIAFSDWFLSLNNMLFCFLHVSSWLESSFLFRAEKYSIVWMNPSFFIYSPTEWHFGSFQVLEIMNKAAINISVHVFVWTQVLNSFR